ncbi:very-long-chain (3R)-3-hydroxyacyl-CoA dehydratase-like [Hydractinia symbiolongicarpus]|uniref:very-long-chain (3R)-3-hydroxyacyl-CoA dehydratase-like n=1 Tax=Hydractinia symbiolongicarpus TaxID=13093 RepID=UPI00254BC52A|nr:very-long-chain (3R)-3-hydroxyacyl-CoA dehydratase-like [Hydractinia symbiolongicarpus]
MAEFLTPIVRWAQNGPTIDLTVDLIDVKKPKIVLDETTLEFRGFGHGAQGENIYQFNLEFFSKIDYKDSNYKVTERNVSFQLKKQVKGEEWPRLLKSEQKPGWLKVDFDKLRLEDSDKGEEDETERINKISFEQRIKSEVEKAKNDLGIYTRVAWLTIYNLFQAVCFMIILFKLLYNLYQHGKDVRLHFYDDVSDLLLTCQLAAIIEVINPLVGIVKTGVTAPLMQVGGRNFVLFVLIVPVKEFHHDWTVFVLFFAWAAIEVIRYPFYIITLHRYTNIVIEWLRYSAWIPLYPAGMSCEVLIMYRSIWISKDSKRWEYPLPNTLNISISLSSIIGFCLCAYTPVALQLMKHMWILRKRKLGGQKKFKQQ